MGWVFRELDVASRNLGPREYSAGGKSGSRLNRRDFRPSAEDHLPAALGWAALSQGIVYSLVTYSSLVSNYPFARGWSEVSRYYGASLFFAERIYGMELPLSVLHPAWHMLLTPPFLLGAPPLWVHRLWTALLSVGLTAALTLAVLKRLKIQGRAAWALA